MAFNSFADAVDFLDSFTNWEKRPGNIPARAWGLNRVVEFSRRIADPWRAYTSLHVAGTKGKGSTCTYAAAMLSAAGFKTGLYLSPHVNHLRERIQIDGEWISETCFMDALAELKPILAEIRADATQRPPSYFEILTHLAFLAFQAANVDVAVVETGLGGRLDATSIIEPAACAITSISLDHVGTLGDTIDKIAYEKAGIIYPGAPVVLGPQSPDALAVIEREAASRHASVIRFSEVERALPKTLTPRQLGAHQRENLAVAYALTTAAGYALEPSVAQAGLNTVSLPGRCERIGLPPEKYGASECLIDGAHNRASAHALRRVLDEWISERIADGQSKTRVQRVMVFACAGNKDIPAIVSELAGWPERVIVTTYHSSRHADLDVMANAWRACGVEPERVADPESAFFSGLAGLRGRSGLLCVTGSMYLAGEFTAWYHAHGV